MNRIEDQQIKNKNYSYDTHSIKEYTNCIFMHCNFESCNLIGAKFENCTFNECNLSMANIAGVAFQDVRFLDCKLLGLRWDECNDFGLSIFFRGCYLNDSSFYGLKLRKTTFESCTLHEVDFSTADLSESVFIDSDLENAVFQQTNLVKTDFRSAINYSINPEQNKIKKAKFSIPEVVGLLTQHDIIIQ